MNKTSPLPTVEEKFEAYSHTAWYLYFVMLLPSRFDPPCISFPQLFLDGRSHIF
jgi:hypothetical protein